MAAPLLLGSIAVPVLSTGGGDDAPVLSTGGGDDAPVLSTGGGDDAPVLSTGGGDDAPVLSTGGGDDRDYIVLSQVGGREACHEACVAENATLACIDTDIETYRVSQLLRHAPGRVGDAWLAACSTEYDNWAPGQPSDGDCNTVDQRGRWHAVDCLSERQCLCERSGGVDYESEAWRELAIFLAANGLWSALLFTAFLRWLRESKRRSQASLPSGGGSRKTRFSVAARLRSATRVGRSLRARVQGLLITVGVIVLSWAFLPSLMFIFGWWPRRLAGSCFVWLHFAMLGVSSIGLAVRPVDHAVIRYISLFASVVASALAGLLLYASVSGLDDPTLRICFFIGGLAALTFCPIFYHAYYVSRTRPRAAWRGIWLGCRLAHGAIGAMVLVYFTLAALLDQKLVPDWWPFATSTDLLQHPDGIPIISYSENFRVVSFDKLRASDFDLSRPSQVQDHSHKAELGMCDAFLSHSWHDSPTAKWDALCRWASDFEKESGRPPRVWFDRACIDQDKLAESLACLPIFLAGCAKLVVLAGPTWPSRLWCVIELFTFQKMTSGAQLDRISVIPLVDGQGTDARKRSLERSIGALRSFDAETATCFKPEDREAMLSVIEASMGSFGEFNSWAKTVFEHRRLSDRRAIELISSRVPSGSQRALSRMTRGLRGSITGFFRIGARGLSRGRSTGAKVASRSTAPGGVLQEAGGGGACQQLHESRDSEELRRELSLTIKVVPRRGSSEKSNALVGDGAPGDFAALGEPRQRHSAPSSLVLRLV
ncbi:hypothetical protein EMIHUDRAFT_456968 [Emiliania huxleyi CCMP1516]|uniref:C-type lectin domain-containing protein n=2 Tax=Emiliania huxleyi TaxID=2903 RepID=A0A0D3JXM9_EMIH1|nr:hypothetical protein EMIHUDRAFT_456968 [Emiliania huxleyi CCMP1516]EOD28264.1 hypothetical protein EMIHUDRAFT_456968 [Emiliania huxleyi CCMP1516]|eukprot:XP_005780693.1 hypothetical protein EMIHUDRAFT_456968 [Emiliania huxleyi CCMP1516]